MHPDTASETHKMVHFRPLEAGACGWFILGDVDIGHDHVAGSIHKVAIQVGLMILVFLRDLEVARLGRVVLIARADHRHASQRAAFVEEGLLIAEIDGDARRARHAIAIPVGILVRIVQRGARHRVRREGLQILRLTAQAGGAEATAGGQHGGAGGEEQESGRKEGRKGHQGLGKRGNRSFDLRKCRFSQHCPPFHAPAVFAAGSMNAEIREVALCFQSGGASLARGCDRLAVDVIGHVPGGKKALRFRAGALRLQDVAVFIAIHELAEEGRVWHMADGHKDALHLQLALRAGDEVFEGHSAHLAFFIGEVFAHGGVGALGCTSVALVNPWLEAN